MLFEAAIDYLIKDGQFQKLIATIPTFKQLTGSKPGMATKMFFIQFLIALWTKRN